MPGRQLRKTGARKQDEDDRENQITYLVIREMKMHAYHPAKWQYEDKINN